MTEWDLLDSPVEHTPHRISKGIAIVAFGATRDLAPWDKSEPWWIWTLNDAYVHFATRIHTLFEMHPPEHYRNHELYVPNHEGRLAEIAEKVDVVLAFPNPAIPKGKLYPLDDVLRVFGRKYFCSSIAYMIPLAILSIEASQKAGDAVFLPKIGVWGADMQLTSEYAKERACVEYWLGRAEERGIEVYTDDRTPLLKMGYLYGYETPEVDKRRELIAGRQHEIQNLLAQDEQKLEDAKRILAEHRGMLSETAWFASVFTDAPHAGEQTK